jgi:hypothetical protein
MFDIPRSLSIYQDVSLLQLCNYFIIFGWKRILIEEGILFAYLRAWIEDFLQVEEPARLVVSETW